MKKKTIYKTPGYIYIVFNRLTPGFIKVGKTKNLKQRLASLNTGSPIKFNLLYAEHFEYCDFIERYIHDTMDFRVSRRKEWYEYNHKIAMSRTDLVGEIKECIEFAKTILAILPRKGVS
jgi:T5orf172 domain